MASLVRGLKLIVWILPITCISSGAMAQKVYRASIEVQFKQEKYVNQHLLPNGGPAACGPAAVLIALGLGNVGLQSARDAIPGENAQQQLVNAIRTYGNVTSDAYQQTRNRFVASSGMAPSDLRDFANDILKQKNLGPLDGLFLNRRSKEGPMTNQFIRRIHTFLVRSLTRGVPPIISLRSFSAKYYPNEQGFRWDSMSNHFVVITSVPAELSGHQLGFAFEYVDPNGTGAPRKSGYISQEFQRNFSAAKGEGLSYEWISNFPFLIVRIPDLFTLDVGNAPWFARTNVVLNYGIGDFRRSDNKE